MSLVEGTAAGYQKSTDTGLNGGSGWDRNRVNEQQYDRDTKAELAPKCIRLSKKN